MRVLCLVNSDSGLETAPSTSALVLGAARRGGVAWIAGLDDVAVDPDGRVSFSALAVHPGEPAAALWEARAAGPVRMRDNELDVLLIRADPGRDPERSLLHETTLDLCRIAKRNGLLVLNDPDALPRASDDLLLPYLPEYLRPRVLLSRDPRHLREFIEEQEGPTLLKPLFGTQRRGTFRVTGAGPNLAALVEALTANGYVMAQEDLRSRAEGSTRVLLVDGEPLEVDQKRCAVLRPPAVDAEARGRSALGGRLSRAELTPLALHALGTIGTLLLEQGIWMASVELVGTKATEINVRCPGGLVEASQLEGVDFVGAALGSFEAKAR